MKPSFATQLATALFEATHNFACVYVKAPPNISKEITKWSKCIDQKHLAEDGIEKEHHVTVLYGLISPKADEIKEALTGFGQIEITLGKLSLFENDDADVLKIEMSAKPLLPLRKELLKFKHELTYPDYKPHMTIAYLKPGKGSNYISKHPWKDKTFKVDAAVLSTKGGAKTTIKLE